MYCCASLLGLMLLPPACRALFNLCSIWQSLDFASHFTCHLCGRVPSLTNVFPACLLPKNLPFHALFTFCLPFLILVSHYMWIIFFLTGVSLLRASLSLSYPSVFSSQHIAASLYIFVDLLLLAW